MFCCGGKKRASVEPEATAAAMDEARYSELKPTSVEKDREPHRWGAGGPRINAR